MKTILTIGLALGLGLGALPIRAEDTAAVNEVLRLQKAGVPAETIVIFVQNQNRNYDLTAERIIFLRDQGLPPAVMNAMLANGRPAPAPAAGPEAVYAPQPTVQPGVVPPIVAQPAFDQDVAYFHQELSPYGQWILTEENQWCWQPAVAVGHPDWRPYWDQGHWLYTDHGWYWSSDYPWGWAAFHYGRWNLHPHHGWIWYPDREWAPAWVTWRMGGDYCGWAPLPQYSRYDYISGGLSFHGNRVAASFGFGLEWAQFNFSYVRDMGERPRARFRSETEARRIYSQTTVINNYSVSKTIVNNESRPRIVNQGIDPGRVAALRGKPVETVRIQDRRVPATTRVPERVDPRARTLEVYRPRLSEPTASARTQPALAPNPRTAAAPSQSERGRPQPPATRPPPAATTRSPGYVSPNPQGAPATRPGAVTAPRESTRTLPATPHASPAKTAPPQRPLPAKSQEDAKPGRGNN